MIKFFRKIRYNLMETGNTGKYFKYAIGEIVLVVIGILIALQINNQNEKRKDRVKEKTILETVLSDLKTNKILIKEGFKDYEIRMSLDEKMVNLFGKNLDPEKIVEFDSILFWSSEYTAIELLSTSITSLLTSERLELLQNESLKQEIIKYPTYIELYKEREDLVRSIVINEMRPNTEQHISLQKWWSIPESFKSDYVKMLNDRQLSNNYLNKLFQSQDATTRLNKLNIANDALIHKVSTELNNRFN